MPPCSCRPSWATSRWHSPAAALAIEAASARRGSSSAMVRAANQQSDAARSTARYMSARRCLSAWNEPIGRPYCSRTLT